MLLRYRSRGVTTKPTLMADHNNNQNTTTSQSSSRRRRTTTTIPSLFLASSKLIRDFTNTFITPTYEVLKSPTSTLDTTRLLLSPNHHRAFGGNPFSYYDDNNNNNNNAKTIPIKTSFSETKSSWEKSVSRGIGLALVKDGDDEDKIDEITCGELPNKGNVLFGTQLRVKTVSAETNCYGKESKDRCSSPTGLLSLSEMMDQLSEEYTCVTSHGPNPKTTHIFNNCIVESYYSSSYYSFPQNSASRNLLSLCYTCKKHLDHTKDIFIYRGEKAFCSRECRQREMMLDGLEESLEFENSSSNGYYY